jgi:CubicO group peptidase (beta-lactamase class C family)
MKAFARLAVQKDHEHGATASLLPSREKVDRVSGPDEGPRMRQTIVVAGPAGKLGAARHPTGLRPATFSLGGRRIANRARLGRERPGRQALRGALLAVLLALTWSAAAPAFAAPPADFQAYADALRKQYGIPGIAVAIVENGQTTMAQGFGVRRLGDPTPVDAMTIFPTGSTGKAFTVAALATLVDAGKLSWDDRVTDKLPGFEMYDPWVTREMTVRDLLVHHSGLGLGEGDLMAVPSSNLTRAETVERLRYLKPKTSFRSGYAYDNVLYAVAGQLIYAVSGQTWEDYMRTHVLEPAHMLDSTSDDPHRFADPDRAWPHARLNGPMRGLGDQAVLDETDDLGKNVSPAGGISASAEDMAQWIKIQLGHGAIPGGGRLYSEASAQAMWTPEVIIPIVPGPPPDTPAPGWARTLEIQSPQFEDYALGWFIRDYRGHKIIEHDGAVFGFRALIDLIPDKNIGFAVLSNAEDGVPLVAIRDQLLDHYLGEPPVDWAKTWGDYKQYQVDAALKALHAEMVQPAKVGPSLPLSSYAGDYADPWYGTVRVTPAGDKLRIDFTHSPGMVGDLTHWQYDTFMTHWDKPGIENAFVSFTLDADGKVAGATMKAVSPLADFSFDYQDLHLAPVAAAAHP